MLSRGEILFPGAQVRGVLDIITSTIGAPPESFMKRVTVKSCATFLRTSSEKLLACREGKASDTPEICSVDGGLFTNEPEICGLRKTSHLASADPMAKDLLKVLQTVPCIVV